MPDLAALQYLHFLRPWWLLLLLLFVPVVWAWRQRSDGSQWRGIIAPHLLEALTLGGGARGWFNPGSVALLLVAIAVLALAGPSWERRPSPFSKDEAVLVIALDTSPSMTASDIQPSRLERAKHKISDLLTLRAGSRNALLIYAGSAHSVIPLTDDGDIMRNFLDAIDETLAPRAGKRPQGILPLADQILRDAGLPGSVLLITDAITDADIDAFASYFNNSNHQLLVLGAGDPEVQARQPLDETGLEALATATGGRYQRLTLDDSDVRRFARMVDNHLVVADDSSRPWVDAGYYLSFPLALVFLLWFRRGWTLKWSVVLLAGLGGAPEQAHADWRFADLWASRDQQGMYYYNRGEYLEAAQRFRDPAWKASAYYLNEDFDIAAELFASIDGRAAAFARANALAHGRRYVQARAAYEALLQKNPRHQGAKNNLVVVQKIIDEVNRMSESQKAEPGDASRELGDEPQTGDGAQRDELMAIEQEQFSAEDILNDPALNEVWMKQIQQDPRRFLGVKFQMQLRAQQAPAAGGEAADVQ